MEKVGSEEKRDGGKVMRMDRDRKIEKESENNECIQRKREEKLIEREKRGRDKKRWKTKGGNKGEKCGLKTKVGKRS